MFYVPSVSRLQQEVTRYVLFLCSHYCGIAGREQAVAPFLAFSICLGIIWFFPFLVIANGEKLEKSPLELHLFRGGGSNTGEWLYMTNCRNKKGVINTCSVLNGTMVNIVFSVTYYWLKGSHRQGTSIYSFCVLYLPVLCWKWTLASFLGFAHPTPDFFPLTLHKRRKIVRGHYSFNYVQGVPLQTTRVGIALLFRALCCSCNNAAILRGYFS